jgi:oxygen-independent coproporphyrinogen-3 oxidase
MAANAAFDIELIRRYDTRGPRYTSYPTALQFDAAFDSNDYRAAALLSNQRLTPLSLYVHVPFCASPCFYCACNRVITRNPAHAARYVAALLREITLQAPLFHARRVVEQLHFGGGTPTFLTTSQIAAVMQQLQREFTLQRSGEREFSIEIDPRTVASGTIAGLADIGFNRYSLGVQDFDPTVQQAVNREQSVAQVQAVVQQIRATGCDAISFDLIYGLPFQTLPGFHRTLLQVLDMRPSRIAIYGYAHLPANVKAQRQFDAASLPSAKQRLDLLQLSVATLTDAGYVHIGLDHFALPTDGLVEAQTAGHLHRNFQGYSSHASCDLVGLGVSAIGKTGDALAQNAKELDAYYRRVDNHQLPVTRGLKLSVDDRLRADVIQQIMCSGEVDCAAIEDVYCIHFDSYFAPELVRLRSMLDDGVLCALGRHIRVSSQGRFLLRNVAMVFDAYVACQPPAHAKTI